MTTWTLVNGRYVNHSGVYDVQHSERGIVATGLDYDACREYIYANAAPDDWYMEADNANYVGNSIAALQEAAADLDAVIDGKITSEEWHARANARVGK